MRKIERKASIQLKHIQEFVHEIHKESPMDQNNECIDHQAAISNSEKEISVSTMMLDEEKMPTRCK
jgi:hypothetical protein